MAATHSYNAEPDMLIEFPSGTTKLQIRFETPARFSTQSIVTGRVPNYELVENAVTKAGAIARKCQFGLIFPTNFKIKGIAINTYVASPNNTTKQNQATDCND